MKDKNPDIDDRHVLIYKHRGIDIYTLSKATPVAGDKLGYVIDHDCF